MPESSTNCRILRSAGGLPSSSLQMNTIVSAYGPLVMKVFEPLSTYSSPSWRAVDFIEPKASEPESGSVIAQAPILSRVSRSSAQRSFWAMVPLPMIGGGGQAHRHAHGGDHAGADPAQLDDRDHGEGELLASRAAVGLLRRRPRPPAMAFSRSMRFLKLSRWHLVHAEGREQLAQHVVRRDVAELELLAVRPDLRSTKSRDRLRTISCSSDHSYTGHSLLVGRRSLAKLDRSVKFRPRRRPGRNAGAAHGSCSELGVRDLDHRWSPPLSASSSTLREALRRFFSERAVLRPPVGLGDTARHADVSAGGRERRRGTRAA